MRAIVDLREEQLLELSEICARIDILSALKGGEDVKASLLWFRAKSLLELVHGKN